MADIVSLPDEGDKDPSLWGCNYAPAFDPNDTGASGFDDLYEAAGDEGYVTLPPHTDSSPNSLIVTAFNCERLSAQDIVILTKHMCNCPEASCMKCKGIAPRLIEPGWMMDSGASNHFTPLKSDFISYRSFPSPERANTAANPLKILGFGTVLIQYELEKKGKTHKKLVRLREVLYVPQISQRILSLGSFLREGLRVYGDLEKITLYISGKDIPVMQCVPLTGKGTIYWLMAEKAIRGTINKVFNEDYDLMHRRMGHPSKEVLRRAQDQTKGFPSIKYPWDTPVCPGCALGRMPQKAFPPSASRASSPLIKIHLDVKSFPIESYHHYKYFISFVDDHSQFAWIVCIRQKSSAIVALQNFLAMLETQYGKTPKEWMSDAGGEYKSQEFLKVLQSKGIKVLQSVPHTPQQNGRAERFNRTLMDKVKALQHEACLPDSWWEFAVEHALHCYNRTPVMRLHWRTPYEAIHHEQPDISMLRVFGCGAYVYLPPTVRKDKLAPNSELMIHLGQAEGIKGYRFMRDSGRIFTAPDVLFDEELYPKCKTQYKRPTTRIHEPRDEQPPGSSKDAPSAPPSETIPWDVKGNERPNPPSLPPPRQPPAPPPTPPSPKPGPSRRPQTPERREPPPLPIRSPQRPPPRRLQSRSPPPRRSERLRRPPTRPGNVYGEQRHPTEIERDIGRTRQWERMTGSQPSTPESREDPLEYRDLNPDPQGSDTHPPPSPPDGDESSEKENSESSSGDNATSSDQSQSEVEMSLTLLAQEGGVKAINYLLAKAVSPQSLVPDVSNIREWSFKDIMRLPSSTQKEWIDACRQELDSL